MITRLESGIEVPQNISKMHGGVEVPIGSGNFMRSGVEVPFYRRNVQATLAYYGAYASYTETYQPTVTVTNLCDNNNFSFKVTGSSGNDGSGSPYVIATVTVPFSPGNFISGEQLLKIVGAATVAHVGDGYNSDFLQFYLGPFDGVYADPQCAADYLSAPVGTLSLNETLTATIGKNLSTLAVEIHAGFSIGSHESGYMTVTIPWSAFQLAPTGEIFEHTT